MILVLGDLDEPMVEDLLDELDRRQQDYCHLSSDQIPHDVSISVALPHAESGLEWSDGTRLPWHQVKSVYHRLGFATFEEEEDYSEAEKSFAAVEFMGALIPILNNLDARVANRPFSSSTNASKPFQTSLIQKAGFSIPETLVTSDPDDARDFYELHDGLVIYKSISYIRSIVEQMNEEDLDRLDTLLTCPVQLQQMVPGGDFRVHVMGEQVFAHKIEATENDYRYDKEAEIVAFDLDKETEAKCIDVARRLNMEIAGVDLRVTPDGETYCFEVNPSPAFSWYEVRTGQPITSALCDLLMDT